MAGREGRYSLAHLAVLSNNVLAERVTTLCNKLENFGTVGIRTAQHLYRVADNLALFTPFAIYQYVDPPGLEKSLEQKQAGLVLGLLPLFRKILIVLPLAFTLAILSWAFTHYQLLLSSRPWLTPVPFIELWEDGFDTYNSLFAPSNIAAVDVFLLLLLMGVEILLYVLQRRARRLAQQIREELESVLEELSELSRKL